MMSNRKVLIVQDFEQPRYKHSEERRGVRGHAYLSVETPYERLYDDEPFARSAIMISAITRSRIAGIYFGNTIGIT